MITAAEAVELDRVETDEPDFYAPLLFLVLSRLLPPETPAANIRAAILTSYADMQERATAQESENV